MTRVLLLLAALLPAACSPRLGIDPAQVPDAECRAEATRDPTVTQYGRSFWATNLQNEDRVRADAAQAFLRAYRNCMVRRGLTQPGGVEPVRPIR